MANPELEEKLMANLTELNDLEQNEISLVIGIYANQCSQYMEDREKDFINSIADKINYYGGEKTFYEFKINQLVEQYISLISKIIEQYDTRMMAILAEVSNTEINQKTAIANMKMSIDMRNEAKVEATQNQKNNYEIVLGECFRQADNVWNECSGKLDEIFPLKSNQLALKKEFFWKAFLNLFHKKKNIEKFVFEATKLELEQLEEKVNEEIEKINRETIIHIAVIKDAQQQTRNIFQEML